MASPAAKASLGRWFGWRGVWVAAVGLAVLLAVHGAARAWAHANRSLDIPLWWPVSVVFARFSPPRVFDARLVRGGGVLLAYEVVARWVFRANRKELWRVTLGGVVLVLASTAIQGLPSGLTDPVSGWLYGGIQYYHDAIAIGSAHELLTHFDRWQPFLLPHSLTHPPGPILLYFWLHQALRSPLAIGLVLTYASIAVGAVSVWRLAEAGGDARAHGAAALATWAFLCLPATQVYGCSCFDFFLAALMAATAALVVATEGVGSALLAGLVLFAVSMGTFVWPFALVMAGLAEHGLKGRLSRTAGALAVTLALHAGLAAATGFNYVAAFRFASHHENPAGFWLLATPFNYLVTRAECICEVALFAGPFALLAMWAGARRRHAGAAVLRRLGLAAPLLVVLMLLTGAFRTGETARATGFVYPFLMLLVARVPTVTGEDIDPVRLGRPIFAQGVIMQVLGWYFW